MNFKEFHINGKYALAVALIAGITTLGASAIQVYKPFSNQKTYKTLRVTKDKNNLYAANYLVNEGVNINIFDGFKKEDFSVNPTGSKIVYLIPVVGGRGNLIKSTLKILNYDTSYSNEIKLYSYFGNTGSTLEIGYCEISIKGWEKTTSLVLSINGCSEGSIPVTMMGYSVEGYPQIKTVNGYSDIKNDGDYVVSFNKFNKVSNVLSINN